MSRSGTLSVGGADRAARVEGMHATSRRWDLLLSGALFAAILIALVIAALVLDPLGASLP